MKIRLILAFTAYLYGCSSLTEKSAPEFSVTVDEMTSAILKFRESDKDILVMALVDHNGDVVRSKFIEWSERKKATFSNQAKQSIEFYVRQDLKLPNISIAAGSYNTIFQAFDIEVFTSDIPALLRP